MPVELNTFRNAVEHVHDDSFVRMSRSRPGEIVNYGTSFLGRKLGWYRHGTVAQNQDIREQLYMALEKQAGSSVQADTLERIRVLLGINEEGKSTKVTQLTAREVKQIFTDVDTDNANYQARKNLSKALGKEYSHPELTAIIERHLKLGDPKESIKPLTEEAQKALLAELKTAGIAIYAKEKAELDLPEISEILTLAKYSDSIDTILKTMVQASQEGKVSKAALQSALVKINESRAYSMRPQIEAKLQQALDQLKAETGVEYTEEGKNALLNNLLDSIKRIAHKEPKLIRDTSILNDAIDEKIGQLIQQRRTMIDAIQQSDPKLDPMIEKGLLDIVIKDIKFNQPKVAFVMAKHFAMAGDLFEYSREPNPTITGFLEKLESWEEHYDAAHKETKAVFEGDFGGDDLQRINDWLVTLAKSCYKSKYGTEPQMNAKLKQLLERFVSELTFVQEHPKAGMKDLSQTYAYSPNYVDDVRFVHFFRVAESFAEVFDPDLQINPPMAEKLSDEVGDHLVKTGNIARRYPDPLGKVIDVKLGSAFMDTFMKDFEKYTNQSDNDSLTDYTQLFQATTVDLNRPGIGLKLNGKTISISGKSGMEGKGLADIQQFFEEDKKFGINAARVLCGVLHQGTAINCTKSLFTTGEACGGMFGQINSYALEFNVTRKGDGQYAIDFKYDLIPSMSTLPNGETRIFDQNRSRASFEGSLSLIIDPKTEMASFKFAGAPKFHSELHKTDFSQDEHNSVFTVSDPETYELIGNDILLTPELASDAHLKQMLVATPKDNAAIFDYVKDKIITPQDKNVLYALGLTANHIERLTYGLHPEARLTKALMVRLTGPDRAEREKAFNELKAFCQKLADAGWQESLDLDIDDMALATVGGLKVDTSILEDSELAITRAYIKSSHDVEVRTLPEALASGNKQRVAFAKARLAVAIPEARRAMGVDLLKTLAGKFTKDEIETLRTAPDQARIKKYLENIVLKNSDVEPSVQALKSYVEAVKILNA